MSPDLIALRLIRLPAPVSPAAPGRPDPTDPSFAIAIVNRASPKLFLA